MDDPFTECPKCATLLTPTQEKCSKCDFAKTKKDRRFLILDGGSRFHFPKRQPKTLTFRIRESDPNDQYARLYSERVVDTVRVLHLPRYGLANYLKPTPDTPPTKQDADLMANLSRAGKRLIGFCRTNLFKRLESSGYAFLLSIRRHILRNYVYLHALENGLPLPIGPQDFDLFDDRDSDDFGLIAAASLADFTAAGALGYQLFYTEHNGNFGWLRSDVFVEDLSEHLRQDAQRLFSILELAGQWHPEQDQKLAELQNLLTKKHPSQKILIFSQFSDTVSYIQAQPDFRYWRV